MSKIEYTAERVNIDSSQLEILLDTQAGKRGRLGSVHLRSNRQEMKKAIKPIEFNPSREGLRNRSYLKTNPQKVLTHEF